MCICVVDPDSRIVEISAKSGREASKPLILDGSGKIIYLRFELNQDQSQRVQKKKKKKTKKEKKYEAKHDVCKRARRKRGKEENTSNYIIFLQPTSCLFNLAFRSCFKSTLLHASRRFPTSRRWNPIINNKEISFHRRPHKNSITPWPGLNRRVKTSANEFRMEGRLKGGEKETD